jgi:UDP-glucose 4-epimerase
MKVLVTGSAGFVGQHVVRRLIEAGHDVRGFDIRPTAGTVSFVGDLTDVGDVNRAVRDVDAVAHIGAIGDVYQAAKDPVLAARVNVVGTANVVEAVLAAGARLVYASTWEVYGEPEYEPIDEDHPTRPDHPYNITKLAGESLVLAACRLRGLNGISLRLGTAYGPGLRPNSVFRIFIDRARSGEPITIQGDGSQGRQFTHVRDIADAFVKAIGSDVTGQALNVVAPSMVSIKELAERVVERYPTQLVFGPPRPGDVPSALVSSQRAAQVLGWRTSVSFEEGLRELLDE